MMKRNLVSKALVGSMMLASLALAGCGGGSNPAGIDDPYAADTSSQYSDPSYGAGTGTATTGTTGGYGTTTGGYGSTTGGYGTTGSTGAMGGELSANVTKTKNGSFLGMGKFVATVEVNNPSQTQLTGTLTVTFTNKGKPTANVQTQSVTVAPGETQTLTFTDKKWSTDGATVEVTTDNAAAAMPATGAGYGSTTGSYGSTTGSYGSTTGAGTGYGSY